MRGHRALTAVAALVIGAAGALVAAPTPAGAAPACATDEPPQPPATVSWARQRLRPERVAALADGRGVTVAVIDSGVDATHRQLAGRVLRGANFLDGGADGRRDCVGHGTAVASLIAAAPAEGVAVRGLAPAVKILPVRVSEQLLIDGKLQGENVGPGEFGAAIRWAVDHGAKVINLSVVLIRDEPAVRSAIEYARAADVVVVAAAGNAHAENNPDPYPASYDGVLGVGAIGADGVRQEYSQVGDYVDVVAPGGDVPVAWPGGYHVRSGTSYAAPIVAATAALIRQYQPELSADDVVRRIIATADPAPGGAHSPAYGSGVVNPHRALTEAVAVAAPVRARPLAAVEPDPAAAAAQERRQSSRQRAMLLAASGAGVAVLVLLLALVLPRGMRRRWRPAEPAA